MKIKLLSLLLTAVIAANVTAYAETINTDDGKKIEFRLEDSLPQNLAVDVEQDSIIKLIFNKNVVNFSVKENNLKCISLKNEDGQVVPTELIFPDDQIEPDKKREIYIDPVDNLNENTTYTVEISSDMLAKNGSKLGETVYVSFTTLTSKTQEVSETKNAEQPLQPTTEVSNTSQPPEISEESTKEPEESQLKEDAASEEFLKEEVFKENDTEDALQSGEEISSQTTEEIEETAEKSKPFGLISAVVVIALVSSLFIAYKKTKKR